MQHSDSLHPLVNHPCLSLLEENAVRLRKFIKDELKMNVSLPPTLPDPALALCQGTSCGLCPRKLSSRAALAKHLAKHESAAAEPPQLDYEICFVCLVCGRAFANIMQCEQHLWHSGAHDQTPHEAEHESSPIVKLEVTHLD